MSLIMENLPIIVILFPLVAALLCPLIAHFSMDWAKRVVMCALFLSVVCASIQLFQVVATGETVHYSLGGWDPPVGIEFVIDGLNAAVILLVAIISFTTSLFTSPFESYEREEGVLHSVGIYCAIAFLAVGLLGMSSTGDAFNLYVFMEITALSGYALIACGEEKAPMAAFRYLLMGSFGATMYLFGVGFLYAATGTLNMAELAECIPEISDSPLLVLALASMIIGFGTKMALFPLHGWQPAAHANAHPGADPMIAGIMIKVPAYAMLRFFFFVFGGADGLISYFLDAIAVMAVLGILFGSLKALRYDTYNKILAYSSIGQVGYIAIGFAIGNAYGVLGATLHILSHAFMKAGLFYTSGALKYKYGIHYTDQLGQVYREMPITALTMVVCSLSMIGLPPFAGFFSKWYLALGAIENGQYIYVVVLILSSLLSAIYFFRIMERMFMGEKTAKEGAGIMTSGGGMELPMQMIIPMLIMVCAVILLGVFNYYIAGHVLLPVIMEVL